MVKRGGTAGFLLFPERVARSTHLPYARAYGHDQEQTPVSRARTSSSFETDLA